MAVEAVPVEEEEEEPEEELTPEELSCEACRGRHVKHTCGTDPEERKAKKRAQAEARRAKAQKAKEAGAGRSEAGRVGREAALRDARVDCGHRHETVVDPRFDGQNTRQTQSRGSLVPVALFPKKLKKKARSTRRQVRWRRCGGNVGSRSRPLQEEAQEARLG